MTPTATHLFPDLREQLCAAIKIQPDGENAYLITMPFYYPDGDGIGVTLKYDQGRLVFSDEGETLMRLAWALDLESLGEGSREQLLRGALAGHGAENRRGELLVPVKGDDYIHACYGLIQAILEVSDLRYLATDTVYSTFIPEIRRLVESIVPADRRIYRWRDPEIDPKQLYIVDYRISGDRKPIYLFALHNMDRTHEATITINAYRNAGVSFDPVGVANVGGKITKRAIGQFSDVCPTVFQSRQFDHSPFERYLRRFMELGHVEQMTSLLPGQQ